MYIMGIDLQKVSLGSLIISLGLFVDDEIIAVEMMSVKLEEGLSRMEAACYAFRATAMPMLTGTLITCMGFIPIAFAKGITSEFCRSMFPVIAMSLLVSWVISVMVAPLFGTYLIRVKVTDESNKEKKDPYQSKFYVVFRKVLKWCLTHKAIVIASTAALFAASVFLIRFVHQEFFPQSVRPEIIMSMRLPEGTSKKETDAESRRFAEFLDAHKDKIKNYSYYVGTGAPRFVLTIDPQADATNFAQFVIVAKDVEARKEMTEAIRKELSDNFPNVHPNLQFIQTGPPAEYPVMLRVSGYDKDKVRELSDEVVRRLAENGNYVDINRNWNEKTKTVHLELDQAKLRAMGISGQQLAQTLYTEITGASVAEYYKGDRTIDIQVRLKDVDRNDLSKLKDIQVFIGAKGYVPLSQIAKISYEAEDGLIWRYNLLPTITVQANVATGTGNDGAIKAFKMTKDLREQLPLGYSIKPAGSLEDSDTAMGFLLTPVPAMAFIIVTLLMIQLRKVKLVVLTLLTAPMGIIGVTFGMLLFNKALGFVAYLGILALMGMIIRNSVVLIDQILKHLDEGETPWDAVVDSAILRFRPIMLTAATTILGMVPLMTSAFWGPMATAIACGLVVATVLTLLVLPCMYAAVYKVKEE
jgi:multidrug efflux pump